MRCLIAALLPLPAAAECLPAPEIAVEAAPLLDALRNAASEAEARHLMDGLWQLWLEAPDATAQGLLDEGMVRREVRDLRAAHDAFDRLVEYCPDYAEGWNQRAFAAFLMQDFAAALPDLDRALALEPNHVGALSGRAMTLLALGRIDEGQAALRYALAVNPWLSERAMLIELPGTEL